ELVRGGLGGEREHNVARGGLPARGVRGDGVAGERHQPVLLDSARSADDAHVEVDAAGTEQGVFGGEHQLRDGDAVGRHGVHGRGRGDVHGSGVHRAERREVREQGLERRRERSRVRRHKHGDVRDNGELHHQLGVERLLPAHHREHRGPGQSRSCGGRLLAAGGDADNGERAVAGEQLLLHRLHRDGRRTEQLGHAGGVHADAADDHPVELGSHLAGEHAVGGAKRLREPDARGGDELLLQRGGGERVRGAVGVR
ncbi:MAG: hypothetical protein DRN08_05400, partial [Thermoplasmata archaeon]